MFTKNIKLIGIVALIVVVVMVLSAVIATSNTKKAVGEVTTDYQTKIDALNKTIDELNKGLISANEALEALKAAGVELENWNAATDALVVKAEELQKAAEAFVESKTVYAEDGETVLVDFDDQYNDDDKFEEIYLNAMLDLVRATSVEAMDAVIAGLTKSLEEIPTMLEKLYTALEAAEKDGVSYDDYENITLAHKLFTVEITNDKVYAEAAEGEEKGEKELIKERLDALYVDFKPIVVDTFVELVNALPTVEMLAPSHEEALDKAVEEYEFVLELYNNNHTDLLTDKKGKETDYAKAVATKVELEARMVVIEGIVEAAELVNDAIAAKKDFKIAADRASRDMIATLEASVEAWETTHAIVTDSEDEDYNAELYNLVNRAGIESYNATLLSKVADLKVLADAYIAEIDAMEVITHNSKEALDASLESWLTFTDAAGELSPADVDYIVDYDSEEGVVAAWNTYAANLSTYNNILATIATIENGVKAVMKVDCKVDHGKDEDGNAIACDCEVNVLDETKLANLDVTTIDAAIVELLATYKLDETAVNADLLAIYKTARLANKIAAAEANVLAAYNASANVDKDSIKASLETLVERAAAKAYTFEVELVCTCDPDSDEECECDTYKLVDDAATKALAVFTVDYCAGFFAVVETETEVQ